MGLCKLVNAEPSPPKLDAVTLAWKLGVEKSKLYAGKIVSTFPLYAEWDAACSCV